MSIEMTLTLAIAAGLLMGAIVIRALVLGVIRLGTFLVRWARPVPARHSTRTFIPDRTATPTVGRLAPVRATARSGGKLPPL